MLCIDLREVQAAAGRLLEQISLLERLLEELEQIRDEIKGQSFTEEAYCLIGNCIEEAEKERRIFLQMSECLIQAAERYGKTERQIADVFNLEIRYFPRTVFGISQFGNLEKNQELIPIRGI